MKRLFRRCGHASGALSLEDQAAVDQFRAAVGLLEHAQPSVPRSSDHEPGKT
jgi:hypothetical protein